VRLQQSPTGLIGLLNLKATGQNPDEFSGVVTPVIEASQYYAQRVRQIYRAEIVTDGPGPSYAALGPPQGEAWLVSAIGLTCLRDGADIALELQSTARLVRSGSTSVCTLFNAQFGAVSNVIDLTQYRGIWLPRPILLSDGDEIRCSAQISSSALASYSMQLDTAVLPG
jgi:hypothetical protein